MYTVCLWLIVVYIVLSVGTRIESFLLFSFWFRKWRFKQQTALNTTAKVLNTECGSQMNDLLKAGRAWELDAIWNKLRRKW